jgi:uncharacterized protein (TIGR03437 family)
MLFAAFVPLALGQTTTLTYSYNGLPLRILPDSADAWSYVRVFVPRSIIVSSVTASVQVDYSGVGDLNVYVFSAAGTRTKLLERNCGSLQNIDTTFDDAAPSKFAAFCPGEAGRGPFSGNEPLANSKGENAYGYWTLAVENNGSDKTGFINEFSVTITGTSTGDATIAPQTIVSATNFKSGAVAPGEMLAIFGVNLGPSGGMTASDTTLPTSLGQTSVTFDGAAVPLYYVSDKLVVVHAPTSLVAGNSTSIQVNSAAGASKSIPLPIVPARPGIFTYEAGPTGQAKVVNEDGTLNDSEHPAAVGTTIQVFATGLGVLEPPLKEGVPAPQDPLSITSLPVSATVGGRPATVTYAGAAPGLVGAYQVNLMIPKATPRGAVTLVLSVGDNFSQDDVTVQVQ